jgi:hypothetical protein
VESLTKRREIGRSAWSGFRIYIPPRANLFKIYLPIGRYRWTGPAESCEPRSIIISSGKIQCHYVYSNTALHSAYYKHRHSSFQIARCSPRNRQRAQLRLCPLRSVPDDCAGYLATDERRSHLTRCELSPLVLTSMINLYFRHWYPNYTGALTDESSRSQTRKSQSFATKIRPIPIRAIVILQSRQFSVSWQSIVDS